MTGDKFAKAINKKLPKQPSTLLFGTVLSTSPLSVEVKGYPTLPASMLIRGWCCDYIDTGNVQTCGCPIYRSVQAGDTVLLVASANLQKYYIAEVGT